MRDRWMALAEIPDRVEWVFGIDEDDHDSINSLAGLRCHVSKEGGGCCRAYNETAASTDGEVIVCASDDVYPIPLWDTEIVKRFGDVSQPRVMSVSDGIRKDRLVPIQILTRAWFDRFGFIFPPQFKSMFGDVWLIERAWRDGCMIDANDLIFEHKHPYFGTAENDAVYEAENAPERYKDGEIALKDALEKLPISLCMIVGNEEENIQRCLEAASGVADEICMVRAVGTQTPDHTIMFAKAIANRYQIPFRFSEYQNSKPFPHVDDFAAARNLSFSLATGHWCLWLDADDVICPVNFLRIREVARAARFKAYSFKYVMPTGAEYLRERLIKRGEGIWRNPVHETCEVSDIVCAVPQVEIHHKPKDGTRPESARRNLAILQDVTKDLPRHWYYYHAELFRLGNKEEATSSGIAALKILPQAMFCERYEVFLNLIDLDPDRAEQWIWQAIATDPMRREAFAYLVQHAMAHGQIQKALVYFKTLDAIPEPNPKPWTHRACFHGWARDYLFVRLLRAAGETQRAADLHAKCMRQEQYAKGVSAYE